MVLDPLVALGGSCKHCLDRLPTDAAAQHWDCSILLYRRKKVIN